MDTGIGSAGAVDSDAGFTREPSQSAFELALDRPGTSLYLETGKVSSVVFNPRAVTNGAALSGALYLADLPVGRFLFCLDQLELDHGRGVAGAIADLHDPGVARVAV